MALQNKQGNYLKIMYLGFPDNIVADVFESKEKRISGVNEQFEKVERLSEYVPDLAKNLNEMADAKISVWNNIITTAYKTLKALDKYKDWTDV